MGKKERHTAIMELIQQKELETQEDLIQALLEQGISVTQATISRDIRELQLVKQHLENGVCCLRDAILRTDYAGQIAVLHCRSGTAQAICAAVDAKQDHRIVGTIAGDDTIFILLRSEEQAAFFAKQYAVWMQTEEGETIC